MVYWIASIIAGLVLIGFAFVAYFLRDGKSGNFARFIFRYLVVFVFFLLAEALVIGSAPWVHEALSAFTAGVVTGILRPLGTEASASASMLSVQDPYLLYDISVSCLGGLLLWVYIGLIWAEPGLTRKQRLTGVLAGLPVLLAFNVFRITTTIYVEWAWGPRIHDGFYALNMVFVILLWMIWFRRVRNTPPPLPASRPVGKSSQPKASKTSPASNVAVSTRQLESGHSVKKDWAPVLGKYQPWEKPPEHNGNGRR